MSTPSEPDDSITLVDCGLKGAPVSIHAGDEPYARNGTSPPQQSRLARVLGHLPGSRWSGCPIDEPFADGDVLDVAGGLLVVHAPGHTPGHVSFLHLSSGVLITGDALFNFRTRLAGHFVLQRRTDPADRRDSVG